MHYQRLGQSRGALGGSLWPVGGYKEAGSSETSLPVLEPPVQQSHSTTEESS